MLIRVILSFESPSNARAEGAASGEHEEPIPDSDESGSEP